MTNIDSEARSAVLDVVFKRMRTPAELAEARAQLIHAGFTCCGACSTWHDEAMRAAAHGSAHDPRCPACGADPALLVEGD